MSRRSRKDKPKKSQPKALDFNLTPQGVLIKTSNNAEKISFFDQKMAAYEKQLQSMDPDYAYSIAVGKIQRVLDEVTESKRRPISCKAGCSACCHQKVDLGPFEGELIRKFLDEGRIEIDSARLEKQAQALQSSEDGYGRLSFEDRGCVFLSREQTCSIYSVRPLMCRRHFVQNDPAICRTEEFFRLEMDVNPDTDAYLSAYVTKYAVRSLPEFIQDLELARAGPTFSQSEQK